MRPDATTKTIKAIKYDIQTKIIPGHGLVLQFCICRSFPVHLNPSNTGYGLSQVRVLCCIPKPQVTSQVSQIDHVLQLPLTKNRKY